VDFKEIYTLSLKHGIKIKYKLTVQANNLKLVPCKRVPTLPPLSLLKIDKNSDIYLNVVVEECSINSFIKLIEEVKRKFNKYKKGDVELEYAITGGAGTLEAGINTEFKLDLKKVKLKDIKKELEKYNNLGIKLTASLRTNPFKSGSNFYLFLVNKVGGFDKIKTSELLDFLYTKKHPLIQINFANSFYDVVRVEILGKKGVIEKTYGILTTHPLLHGLYLDELKEEILIKKYVKRRGIPIPKLERII
jgi:hypothetical protein